MACIGFTVSRRTARLVIAGLVLMLPVAACAGAEAPSSSPVRSPLRLPSTEEVCSLLRVEDVPSQELRFVPDSGSGSPDDNSEVVRADASCSWLDETGPIFAMQVWISGDGRGSPMPDSDYLNDLSANEEALLEIEGFDLAVREGPNVYAVAGKFEVIATDLYFWAEEAKREEIVRLLLVRWLQKARV